MALNKYSLLPDAPSVTIYDAGGGRGRKGLQFPTLAQGQHDMYMRTIDRLSDREQAYRDQEKRQTTVVDQPVKFTINIAREDFPSIMATFDIVYIPTAAQQAWAVLMREAAVKLKVEFIETILDRADRAPVHRIMSLRPGGDYLARQRESSAIMEVINTGKTPAHISWPITRDINNVKKNLIYDDVAMPVIEQRVSSLVRKKMTREIQRQIAFSVHNAPDPDSVVSVIEEFHREYDPDAAQPTTTLEAGAGAAKIQQLQEAVRSKSAASRSTMILAQANAEKERKGPVPPFGQISKYEHTVDIVTLHRLSFEKLARFVAQGLDREVATYPVLMYIKKTITELRSEVDLVAIGLKVVSDIMKHLKEYREQMYHLVLDCIAAYAPPEAAHRKRNPKRLLPPDQLMLLHQQQQQQQQQQQLKPPPGSRGGKSTTPTKTTRKRGKQKLTAAEEEDRRIRERLQHLGVVEISDTGEYQGLARRYGMFYNAGIGCDTADSLNATELNADTFRSRSRGASQQMSQEVNVTKADANMLDRFDKAAITSVTGHQLLNASSSSSCDGNDGDGDGDGGDTFDPDRIGSSSSSISGKIVGSSDTSDTLQQDTTAAAEEEVEVVGESGTWGEGESKVILGRRGRIRNTMATKALQAAYTDPNATSTAIAGGTAATNASGVGVGVGVGVGSAGSGSGKHEKAIKIKESSSKKVTVSNDALQDQQQQQQQKSSRPAKIVFKIKGKDRAQPSQGDNATQQQEAKRWSKSVGELGKKPPKKIEEKKIDFNKKIVYDPEKEKRDAQNAAEIGANTAGGAPAVAVMGEENVAPNTAATASGTVGAAASADVDVEASAGATSDAKQTHAHDDDAAAARASEGTVMGEQGLVVAADVAPGRGEAVAAAAAAVAVAAAAVTKDTGGASLLPAIPAPSSKKSRSSKQKLSYQPLPVVPCIVFRGLSGKLKQNIAMQQSFATLYRMIAFSYGNRDKAFRMFVADEISVIATVCQGMPRVLEYYMWIIDCMYRDGFGEMSPEDMEGVPSDDPTFQVSEDGLTAATATAASSSNVSAAHDPLTGRIIETMSEMSIPSFDEDGTYSEATNILTIGDASAYDQTGNAAAASAAAQAVKTAAAVAADVLGSAKVGTRGSASSKTQRRASAGEGDASIALSDAAVDKNEREAGNALKRARRQQVIDEIGLFEFEQRYTRRPEDVVVIAVALVSSHNEIDTREKEMANRWLDVWDDGSMGYKILKKKGKDLAGL